MNNITVNIDNLSADERDQLVKLIRKANKEPELGYWVPKKGEVYYEACGTECINRYVFNNDEIDKGNIKGFNFFKTKEEAEIHAKKMQIINHMAKIASINPISKKDSYHYEIEYSFDLKKAVIGNCLFFKKMPVAFKTEKLAQRAIKEIGQENLKKYYFGVKD